MKRPHYWYFLVFIIAVFWLGATQTTFALSDLSLSQQYSVQASAAVQASPPQITLSWPAYTLGAPDPNSSNHTIYRKALSETSWTQIGMVSIMATQFVDTNVVVGQGYDYRIMRNPSDATPKYGFVFAGIDLTLPDYRGKLLLLVDDRFSTSLATEIDRLKQDLVGDGWEVIQQNVSSSATVSSVRTIVQTEYNNDPTNLKALFLLGHIPVPYSGNFAPDGHPEHQGAWPTDAYYGDVDGVWTDSTVNHTGGIFANNHNIPGDGKFDPSFLSDVSDVELMVGRVDMDGLWHFFGTHSEEDLLRRYLDKDHNFRHGLLPVQRRGLIDENFSGVGYGYLAYSSWANFAPMFGAANVIDAEWTSMTTDSYLWAYGSGGGWFDSAADVVNSSQLASNQYKVIFTMLLGSWFGEWDSGSNLMRSLLAMEGYGLTAVWSGIPDWYFHHMALGETIGFSHRLSQNLGGVVYDSPTFEARGVHMALLGDPTLRMHVVLPPANVSVAPNPTYGVDLSWDTSADSIIGYHVYEAATSAGPFTRLTTSPVTTTSYTDARRAEPRTYMVRALKLESSASGTYNNLSQGAFVDSMIMAPPIAPAAYLAIVLNGVEVRWDAVMNNINQEPTVVTSYLLYCDTTPYFTPAVPHTTVTPPFSDPISVPHSPSSNQFYTIVAINDEGESAPARQVGYFEFAITPGEA